MTTDSTAFFVILVAYQETTADDGTVSGEWSKKAIYSYATKDEAVKGFHQHLASYINSETYCQVAVSVLDGFGNTLRSEYWMEASTSTDEEDTSETTE